MEKSCENCGYGRLICNEENQENYIGCIKHQSFDANVFLANLDKYHYFSPEKDTILTGWIYKNIPFGQKRNSFDSIDGGVIVNNCLISPKGSFCDLFKLKV